MQDFDALKGEPMSITRYLLRKNVFDYELCVFRCILPLDVDAMNEACKISI